MRSPHDSSADKILHSASSTENPGETYFTLTSMITPGKDERHKMFSFKYSGPSSRTYEIIMVSLCGSIFLLAVAALVLKMIRKRVLHFQSCDHPNGLVKNLDAAETGVEYIIAKHHDGDQILTAQATGPLCIRYVFEKETPPVEFLTLEAKPDSNPMLSFSFISSIAPLDVSPEIDRGGPCLMRTHEQKPSFVRTAWLEKPKLDPS